MGVERLGFWQFWLRVTYQVVGFRVGCNVGIEGLMFSVWRLIAFLAFFIIYQVGGVQV